MVRKNDKTNHIDFITSEIFLLSRIYTNGNEQILGYNSEDGFVSDF